MPEPVKIRENLYTFPIVLPENPLKWLNCYVIAPPDGRSLLIDTGFNRPECLRDLMDGMESLSLDPARTDVFLTHLHSDHTGNAEPLQRLGCRVLMGERDYARLRGSEYNTGDKNSRRFLAEGMPQEDLDRWLNDSPAIIYRAGRFTAETLRDGDTLDYGGYSLRCIETPGHTPGHVCLYDEERKLIFLGDHVLFDISPNICAWPGVEDSLGDYLDSLRRVGRLEVETALPAHRSVGSVSMYERIEQLLEHHRRRLAETERIISESEGIDAYTLAGKMSWRIRARSWEEFPIAQKGFAFNETLAHLDYLRLRGRIRRIEDGGAAHYVSKD